MSHNPIRRLHSRLRSEEERTSVSLYAVSLTLGISYGYLKKLQKLPSSEVSPAIRLACKYVARVGIRSSDDIEDPGHADIQALVDSILLTRTEVATILGMHRQVLYSMETGSQHATVKRFYMLALLELRHLYGLSTEKSEMLAHLPGA